MIGILKHEQLADIFVNIFYVEVSGVNPASVQLFC